jgi:hypothetical protein
MAPRRRQILNGFIEFCAVLVCLAILFGTVYTSESIWLKTIMMVILCAIFVPFIGWLSSTLNREHQSTLPILDPNHPCVILDQVQLDNFFLLSRKACHRLMASWRDAPLFTIHFQDLPVGKFSHARWMLLCRTLGSIPTLRRVSVTVKIDQPTHARTLAMLLQGLRQISDLSIHHSHGRERPRRIFINMVPEYELVSQALRFLSNLESFHCHLPSNAYRTILPGLRELPLLREVTIALDEPEDMDLPDAHALSDCLLDRPYDSVSLHNLVFDSSESWQAFCCGISRVAIRRLMTSNIQVLNAAQFAEAFGAAKVTHLVVRGWTDNETLPKFLASFAEHLHRMSIKSLCLEGLCEPIDGGFRGPHRLYPVVSEGLCLVLQAAANCPELVELKLPIMHYSEAVDESLARLVELEHTSLQALSIGHPLIPRGRRGASYPHFLKALKDNVRITHVSLHRPVLYDAGLPDPWCEDFTTEVFMVTRLNYCGRSYLKQESFNQNLGYRLLEQVNDDADCLFFHVRENPALTCRR